MRRRAPRLPQAETTMPPGDARHGTRSRRRRAGRFFLTLGLALLPIACCQSNPHRAHVEKNLMNERATRAQARAIAEGYLVACPDVLQLRVEGRPEFDA